jgi:phage terminase large subunit-like protein
MDIDHDTRQWLRTAADERAARDGMRFDVERAEFACNWIEENCCLYEGEHAGQSIKLYPAQREFFMRMYGWVRWSDEWQQWIRRFTHITFLAAKKNGKSPAAAAHNLYMLCGDGEQGQKVYQAAGNGEQAKIAQMHAINMVKQSPKLRDDCKINNTTLQITHLPTNSVLMILTGDDSRGAKTKEGLNGSVTYDEMHVVNRQIEERTSRAGISRKEPINAAFSTAGDDPSAVGAERFKYGRQVNNGERHDPHFLHVEYAAPATATDAEIEANLDEYGKAANPAWGELVKPTEFRADWQRSKGKPREVARFKQYRLNIEVGSTNPWLSLAAWQKGKRIYGLAELAGRDCFLGFDAARKLDMTAAVFIFPWEEDGPGVIRLWPMFWLPEETAKERDHLFPFRSWGAGGFLSLTPGGTMDYSRVKGDIRDVITQNSLNVICLYYDMTYANEITQALHEGEQLGKEVVAGVVAAREEVGQGIMHLTGLCCEFERRLLAGLIQHPGNMVMDWQVGHCEVKRDRNQNIAPMKPLPHSGKNIDGVAAAIDAMVGAMKYVPPAVAGGFEMW